jgi:hypothetical protein
MMIPTKRKVIAIGEAVHTALEAVLKTGATMKKHTRTPAQEEALQLRVETARYEKQDYATKTPTVHNMHGGAEGETLQFPDAQLGAADLAEQEFLCPSVDDQLSRPGSSLTGLSIMEEIVEANHMKRMKPFIEGQPIGKIQKWTTGPAPALKTNNEIMEDRRKETLRLRAKNDRALDRLLER